MQHLLAMWVIAASVYHAHLDPRHGTRMPQDEAEDIAAASIAHPLYDGPDGPIRTAALLVIFSALESAHTHVCAVDTDGITRCGPYSLASDPSAAHAIQLLAWSAHSCPAHPWARYSGGCAPIPQRISDQRQALADVLLRASGVGVGVVLESP